MDEQRCRMTAATASDHRCKHLLDSATTGMRDPRYQSLYMQTQAGVEDSRCNPVEMEMEDPRCQGLSSMW
jgi:hypothetical protein